LVNTWHCAKIGAIQIALLAFASRAVALQASDLPPCPPKPAQCIAISLWLAPQTADLAWLRDQIAAANDRLSAINAAIQVTEIHDLSANDREIARVSQRNALAQHGTQTPLRWFVVNILLDAQNPKDLRKGVTWRHQQQVWVIESATAMRWVFAHELGHVLGLPHSKQAASIMNKTPRVWPPPHKIGFTAKELPTMRQTLKKLLAQKRLSLIAH